MKPNLIRKDLRKIISIETQTGDSYCKKNNIKNIDFMKIDVQGSERDVLEGFKIMLKKNNIKIIIVEYDYTDRYNSKGKIADFENFFSKYGYSLFDIISIKRKLLKNYLISNDYLLRIKVQYGLLLFANRKISKDQLYKYNINLKGKKLIDLNLKKNNYLLKFV